MASIISSVELKTIAHRISMISSSFLSGPLEINLIDDDHADPVIEIDSIVALLPWLDTKDGSIKWSLSMPVNRESTLTDYDDICTYQTLDECITNAFGLWAELQVKCYFDRVREKQFIQSQEDKYEAR